MKRLSNEEMNRIAKALRDIVDRMMAKEQAEADSVLPKSSLEVPMPAVKATADTFEPFLLVQNQKFRVVVSPKSLDFEVMDPCRLRPARRRARRASPPDKIPAWINRRRPADQVCGCA